MIAFFILPRIAGATGIYALVKVGPPVLYLIDGRVTSAQVVAAALLCLAIEPGPLDDVDGDVAGAAATAPAKSSA